MNAFPLRLGKEQLQSSRVGIGTWAIGGGWGPQSDEQSLTAINEALDRGCLLIDTAGMYGNGRAEKLIAQAFNQRKQRVTVCTKVAPLGYQWAPATGTPIDSVFPPEHILAQAEESLRRLHVEYIDSLLMQTWCPSWSQEISWYHAMQLLQQQGKIRSFGISVSDRRPYEANGVIEAGRVHIIETSYSLLDQRAATTLLPLAQRSGVSIIARSPLASGALAGDWTPDMRFHRMDWRRRVFRGELFQQTLEKVELLKTLAGPSIPLATFALRFCLSHPAISAVIPGIRDRSQAAENLAVLHQPQLPQEMLDLITLLWEKELKQNVRVSIGEEGEGERRMEQQRNVTE